MEHTNDVWNWPIPDEGRVKRAKAVRLFDISRADSGLSAKSKGSSGKIYQVSLQGCTCVDFAMHRLPCKHMIALALHCGILNENGLTEEQQEENFVQVLSIKVALASAFYHLYNKPFMSDSAYDALKYELWDNSDLIREEEIASHSATCSDKASFEELLNMPLNEFLDRAVNIVDVDPEEFARMVENNSMRE